MPIPVIILFSVLGVIALIGLCYAFKNGYDADKQYKKSSRAYDLARCEVYGCHMDWATGRCSCCDRPMP